MCKEFVFLFSLVLALCLAGSVSAEEDIAFDANSGDFADSRWSLSWPHTIGSGQNRILIVGVAGEDDSDSHLVVDSIKYNDINMSLVTGSSKTVITSGYRMKTELYYLLAPPSGTSDIVVTYSGEITRICGGGISLENVAQGPAEAVATSSVSSAKSISTDITTQTDGAWVVDVVGSSNLGSFTAEGVDMVEQYDTASGSSTGAGSTRPVASAGTVTMSWWHPSTSRMTHSVAAFAPMDPKKASNPSPQHLTIDVAADVELSWIAGESADSHDVYFGTVFEDVRDADNTWPVGTSVYKGNEAIDANSYDPGILESEQVYYWRVDEVNSTDPNIWQGSIWNFTVEQYIPGDFTDDGIISNDDIGMLADEWLDSGPDVEADADWDDKVDFKDYAIVADGWVPIIPDECDDWQSLHPEWIFCDDFESDTAMVRQGRYFEYSSNGGDFAPIEGVGLDGSKGMRTIFQAGEVSAGSLHLGFGRVPQGYFDKGIRNNEDFREIYYRMYLKNQPGWQGSPAKLSRAMSFASPTSWAQAMIAHLWSSGNYLLVDPASGVENGVVVTTKYNDFDNLHWLGNLRGITPIFDSNHDDTWFCIEMHVKLNDPGQYNGVQEFWIDGQLEARRGGMNFVDTWTDYAINAVYLENYWNSGSSQLQERYFDNFVVSTQPIGPWEP